MTFTNKAAREMKERIGALVGDAVEGMPWLGTFHSIGVKILRRHAELVGLKSGFTILDTDDQIRLIKQVIEAEGLDKDRWPARQFAAIMDGWKNRGLIPDKVPKGEGFAFGDGKGITLYAAYQRRLKELNAADFGDLLLECLRLFGENPDVLAEYRRKFRYILVDEYQDTNVAQYLWLRLIAGTSSPTAVPTSAAWVMTTSRSTAGAAPRSTTSCASEADFPGAKVIRLERNYRSKGHILAAASGLIAHNKGRLGKTLFTGCRRRPAPHRARRLGRRRGSPLHRRRDRGPAQKGPAAQRGCHLVRASFQMRAFEDRFVTLGLPYRVIGGPRFYERQEIKDAIAYLEVTLNPTNDLKFERIVNVPKRGLGDTTIARVRDLSRARGISLYQAAREIVETEEISGKARKTLSDLVSSAFERWRRQVEGMRHTELAELILDESGYTHMWQTDKSPQAQFAIGEPEGTHPVHALVREPARFPGACVARDGYGDCGYGRPRFVDDAARRQGPRVRRGFPAGWEEGLFPHQRSLDESGQAGLEEERRLAYVGITRAKKQVTSSFAQNRRTRGLCRRRHHRASSMNCPRATST